MLKQLQTLKISRERGLRHKLADIDRREAELVAQRQRLVEQHRQVQVLRDALFEHQRILAPASFQRLKHRLAQLYEEERSIVARLEDIRAALAACEEARRRKLADLRVNLRGQEKLNHLFEHAEDASSH